jgi:hypothetical protein
MVTNIGDGGAPYQTKIPELGDNADIQAALRIYHFGSDTSNPSPLPEDSVAGHLNALNTVKISKPIAITANANLNNSPYTLTGYYHQPTNSGARTGTSNYPTFGGTQYAGMLEVLTEGAVIYQTYHMYISSTNTIKYWRVYFGGSWSSWQTSTDQITGSASSIVSASLTANRAVIVDSGQKIANSTVSSTELATLVGITTASGSTVQSQLNVKPTIYNTSGVVSGTRIFVQELEPNSTNNSGYTPQAGDLWFW